MGKFFCRGSVKFYDSATNHFGFVTIEASNNPDIIGQDAYIGKIDPEEDAYIPEKADNVYFTIDLERKGAKVYSIIKNTNLLFSEYERYVEVLTLYDSITFFKLLHSKDMLVHHPYKERLSLRLCNGIAIVEQNSEVLFELLKHASYEMIETIISRWNTASFAFKSKLAARFTDNDHKIAIQDDWNTLSLVHKHKHINLLMENGLEWIVRETDWLTEIESYDKESAYFAFKDLLKLKLISEKSFAKVKLSEQDITNIPFDNDIIEQHPDILQSVLSIWINEPDRYFFSDGHYRGIKTFDEKRTAHFITYCNSNESIESLVNFIISSYKSSTLGNDVFIRLLNSSANGGHSSFQNVLKTKLLNYAKSLSIEENIKIRKVLENGGVWYPYTEQLEPLNKLHLYLKDIQTLNRPSIYSHLLPELESQNQCLYISKLAEYYINNRQIDELLTLFNKPLSSEREMDKYAPSILFVSFILKEATRINNLIDIKRMSNLVFEFVYSKLISDSLISDKLSHFFEPCDGRINIGQLASEENTAIVGREISEEELNRYGAPCNFCEGRETTTRDHHEIYWCRNSYCARASRLNYIEKVNDSNITLSYLFGSLGYDNSSISEVTGFINGWVNKINTFLEHLVCRTCKKPLYPIDEGSGYYRCNKFACKNDSCSELMKEVYLTHCINPDCEAYIDSRDSAQCPHGWYVCCNCYGCCTTEKIEKRIEYYNSIGKTYGGATVGHKNLNEICCPDCGSSFSSGYIKMLDRFKEMARQRNHRIRAHGVNNGHSWFLIQVLNNEPIDVFHKGVQKLVEMGFQLGSNYYEGSQTAFIAEPWGTANTYHCSNSDCEHELSLNEIEEERDYGRLRAIKVFHKNALTLLS